MSVQRLLSLSLVLFVGMALLVACGRDRSPEEPAAPVATVAVATDTPMPTPTALPSPTAEPTPTAQAEVAQIPGPIYYIDALSQQLMHLAEGDEPTQLTDEAGPVSEFDLSPDGKLLVYVSENRLIQANLQNGERLVKLEGERIDDSDVEGLINRQIRSPRFSPDGTLIAFGLAGVNIIPAGPSLEVRQLLASSPYPDLTDTGTVQTDEIVRFFWPRAWSPDGSQLLVDFAYFPEAGGLAVLDLGNNELIDLKSDDPNIVACCDAIWSNDSRSLIIASNFLAYGNPGLSLVDAASGVVVNLVAGLPVGTPGEENPFRFFQAPFQTDSGLLLTFVHATAELDQSEQLYTMSEVTADGSSSNPIRSDAQMLEGDIVWAADALGALYVGGSERDEFGVVGPLIWLSTDDGPPLELPVEGRMPRIGPRVQVADVSSAIAPAEVAAYDPAAELEALAAEAWNLEAVAAAAESVAISETHAFQLAGSEAGAEQWVVHTVGMRSSLPEVQNHRVAIYERSPTDWVELSTLELADSEGAESAEPGPDYVDRNWVEEVTLEPDHLWLQVDGGIGAHGGTYHLLAFDGTTLALMAAASNASPGVGSTADLNGDGLADVIIDTTEYYVFCYACGVRLVQSDVLRWDGANLVPVDLAPLPDAAPPALRDATNQAIEWAQAGLWKDAAAEIEKGLTSSFYDPTFEWNFALINLNADMKRAVAEDNGGYPILDHMFYGDFDAAVDVMRAYAPVDIFTAASPLVIGTAAEGWSDELANWLIDTATPALNVRPDLASGYFLRAWGTFLAGGDPALVLADVSQASSLDSQDALYAESVIFLGGSVDSEGAAEVEPEEDLPSIGAGLPVPETARATPRTLINVRAAPGVLEPLVGQLTGGTTVAVVGQTGEGDDVWLEIGFPPDSEETAWIKGDTQFVDITDLSQVPVREEVPTQESEQEVIGDDDGAARVTKQVRLFYSAQDEEGSDAIFLLVPGSEAQLVVTEASQPAIQPGGDRLSFYSSRSDMLGLGGYDLGTEERLRFAFNIEDSLPTWDPNLQQIVFASTRFGDGRWRLYQVWADGAGAAIDLSYGQDPDWHPSEDLIVFKGCDETGAKCGLWTMRSNGSERAQLTDNPSDSRPEWSPDGSFVVFMSSEHDGNWELYRLDIADGQVTRLTNNDANDGLPAISPDGSQVAFMSNRDDAWRIQVIPSSGGPAAGLYTIGDNVANWLEQGVEWQR